MSVHNGPRFTGVVDGLVLCLDAAMPHSYPGSGTNWYDIDPASTNNVVISGTTPSYVSGKNAGIVFNGTDNYANFSVPNLGSVATVEVVAKIGSFGSNMIFGWQSYDLYCWSNAMGYNTANSDVYGIPAATVSSLGLLNNWKHYIFEMRTDVSYTNNKIYVNSVQQTLSQINSTEGGKSFNNGSGRISGWLNGGYYMPMTLGIFKVYNRSLSQAEINVNFNAIRGRYGL